MSKIRETMPHADTVLTELVSDIKHHLCCHLYLNRAGQSVWIAVTEKILDDCIWIGAVIQVYKSFRSIAFYNIWGKGMRNLERTIDFDILRC